MPKQNFTQNLSLSLEFEIRSCTIYYNQLALHSYNMNAEICWQTNWSIMKVWNMYSTGYCLIYYESMKHVQQVLHSYIMKVWNMYSMYCIHILWKYETCTAGTAFIYYESMKHVQQVLHSYIMKVWNMYSRYCIHILWNYETCTAYTAFIHNSMTKHV